MTTLADIDGTNGPAWAILLGVGMVDGEPVVHTKDPYHEVDFENPLQTAMNLKASVKGDFPDWVFTIAYNSRAKFLHWQDQMNRLLGDEHTYSDYLEIL